MGTWHACTSFAVGGKACTFLGKSHDSTIKTLRREKVYSVYTACLCMRAAARRYDIHAYIPVLTLTDSTYQQ